jgi:hypothetical protein
MCPWFDQFPRHQVVHRAPEASSFEMTFQALVPDAAARDGLVPARRVAHAYSATNRD